MPSANSVVGLLLVALALPARAATPVTDVMAPADLLADGNALHAALERAIDRPVWVIGARLDAEGGELVVQDVADEEIYDRYFVVPGGPIRGPQPQKVGSIDCPRNRIPWPKLDLSVVGAVLGDAKARTSGNGFVEPRCAELGADVFCKDFGWRFTALGVENDDVILELVYGFDGKLRSARQFDGERWRKVDAKALAARRAQPPPKPPETAPEEKPGGSADWRFFEDIMPALAALERFIGEPLRLKTVSVSESQLSVELAKKSGGKRLYTYLLAPDGGIKLWNEDDPIPFDCNKPFAVADAPLAAVGELVSRALVAIPPLVDPYPTSVTITRSFSCGAPEVAVYVEDRRARGRVLFDAKGRQREAEIQ